jgi:hypothetical protein
LRSEDQKGKALFTVGERRRAVLAASGKGANGAPGTASRSEVEKKRPPAAKFRRTDRMLFRIKVHKLIFCAVLLL